VGLFSGSKACNRKTKLIVTLLSAGFIFTIFSQLQSPMNRKKAHCLPIVITRHLITMVLVVLFRHCLQMEENLLWETLIKTSQAIWYFSPNDTQDSLVY
jgi:hypothetical protein